MDHFGILYKASMWPVLYDKCIGELMVVCNLMVLHNQYALLSQVFLSFIIINDPGAKHNNAFQNTQYREIFAEIMVGKWKALMEYEH